MTRRGTSEMDRLDTTLEETEEILGDHWDSSYINRYCITVVFIQIDLGNHGALKRSEKKIKIPYTKR